MYNDIALNAAIAASGLCLLKSFLLQIWILRITTIPVLEMLLGFNLIIR